MRAQVASAAAQATVPPEVQDRLKLLLDKYSAVFAELETLPPERNVGHAIRLEPGAVPPYRRPYRLSALELQELERAIADMLKKRGLDRAKLLSLWCARSFCAQT
jgi:hypothetical protein